MVQHGKGASQALSLALEWSVSGSGSRSARETPRNFHGERRDHYGY
jgi:hypothetical protein